MRIPEADRPGEVARRLIAGLRDAGANGGVHVDVESIARVGAFKLRRRRNFTAAGVAAGVVVLVVGGTIIGRPAPTAVHSAGSGPVPVCVASTTTPTSSWAAENSSPRDEGSSTESAASSPYWTAVAGPSAVQGALSAAESAAAAAESSAQVAAVVARASYLDSRTPVSGALGSETETTSANGMIIVRPDWYSTPKQLQLNGALRVAMPKAVKVLDGVTNGIGFDSSSRFQVGFQWQFVTTTGTSDVPIVVYRVRPDQNLTVTASVTIFKPNLGWGTLAVDLTKGKPGAPACSDGAIQQRITKADRTVVDISVVRTIPDSSAQGTSHEVALRVTAYRPDGTIVTAEASTNGTAAQLPMTADELVEVATAPGLDVTTAPNAADSSSAALLTTDQNGVESTLNAPASAPAATAQVSPTH